MGITIAGLTIRNGQCKYNIKPKFHNKNNCATCAHSRTRQEKTRDAGQRRDHSERTMQEHSVKPKVGNKKQLRNVCAKSNTRKKQTRDASQRKTVAQTYIVCICTMHAQQKCGMIWMNKKCDNSTLTVHVVQKSPGDAPSERTSS